MEPTRGTLLAAAMAVFLAAGTGATRADTYVVTNTNPDGPGSLAQAILDSNGRTGQDTIVFNIPGSGLHRIQGFRPAITDSLVIDGYTQPGSHPNTLSVGNDAVILIQLDGGNTAGTWGLILSGANAANCLIRGLAFTGFLSGPSPNGSFLPRLYGYGIKISSDTGAGNVIQGNLIGLNPDGITPGKNEEGVRIEGGQPTIGGVDPAARNVISGNDSGLLIQGPAATVIGNYIGTDPSGTRALENRTGIKIGANDIVVGGTSPGSGNVISGNRFEGIALGYSAGFRIVTRADRALIQGNLIGPQANGVSPLGNGYAGVSVLRGSDSTIGGVDPAAGNVIAFNGRGVSIIGGGTFGSGNSVLSNSIYANSNHGIILEPGSNNAQSAPVITSSRISNDIATINGTLDSVANTTFIIQFFADSQSLTSSEQTYLGSKNVTTNGSGRAAFVASFAVPNRNVVFNATATDPSGNTSEFFRNVAYLQNISTRAAVGSGDNALIGGFIAGYGRIVLRGIGPSLEGWGFDNVLTDPVLDLYDQSGAQIQFNDNWQDDQYQADIIRLGFAPANPAESAIFFFPAGRTTSNTAVLRGKNDTSGVGLVEAYGPDGSLSNLSSRGLVGTDGNVLIGGFIVGDGNESTRIVVRAIGPSLQDFGVADSLADPVLEFHDGNGVLIRSNDDWSDTQSDDLQTVGLAPADAAESAILMRLPAGNYTAIVRGKNDTTGVALVEVYDLR
jgi:hypothetical protein